MGLRETAVSGYLTTAEAAEQLDYHPKAVQTLCRTGRLAAVKNGSGDWRIFPDSVARYRRYRDDPRDRRRPRAEWGRG